MIAKAEITHENRYLKLLQNIEKNEVFTKLTSVKWYCANCGMIVEGTSAPEICPTCLHPKAYFQLAPENY
jgi:rubrerythrin